MSCRLVVMAACFTCHATSRDVQAAKKTGFRTVKGKHTTMILMVRKTQRMAYFKKVRNYFNKSNGVQVKGWLKKTKGRKRYFTSKAGCVMVKGWLSNSKWAAKILCLSITGYMKTKWLEVEWKVLLSLVQVQHCSYRFCEGQ